MEHKKVAKKIDGMSGIKIYGILTSTTSGRQWKGVKQAWRVYVCICIQWVQMCSMYVYNIYCF